MQPLRRNEELERAILADPARLEPYLVWSDWLMTEGDPHGELVALECALLSSPADEERLRRRDEVLSLHAAELLVPHPTLAIERQSLGLVHTARVRAWHPRDLAAGVAALAQSRMARLIQVLRIEIALDRGAHGPKQRVDLHYDEILALVAGSDAFSMLGSLELRCAEYPLIDTFVGSVPRLGALQRLSSVRLRLGQIGALDELALSTLSSLEIELGRVAAQNARSIGRCAFPALGSLELAGTPPAGPAPADLRALLSGAGLPWLRARGLRSLGPLEDLVPVLAASPLLRQLRSLRLPSWEWNESTARLLLKHAGAFGHLGSLSLDVVDAEPSMLEALRGVCASVDVRPRPPPPLPPMNPPPPLPPAPVVAPDDAAAATQPARDRRRS